jgi:hypothetical protein
VLFRSQEKRRANFAFLKANLDGLNELPAELAAASVPMAYPFVNGAKSLRQKLLEHNVFVATYWPNVFTWCASNAVERYLAEHLLPLPVDQRYSEDALSRVVQLIRHFL